MKRDFIYVIFCRHFVSDCAYQSKKACVSSLNRRKAKGSDTVWRFQRISLGLKAKP